MAGIDSILIRDVDDEFAPPSRLLDVTVMDGMVFLSISQYSETHTERSLTREGQITVDIRDLLSAIQLLDAADKSDDQPQTNTEEVREGGHPGTFGVQQA